MESDSSLSSLPRTDKRLKALSLAPSPSKGKQKLDEEEEEEPAEDGSMGSDLEKCGICWSEGGNAVRGLIDSCDHLFCFVCIMEWAKVESRCPMCKGRFSSIRRPPKDGVFAFERVIDVPVRDQAYQFRGNTTIGPYDSYAHVQCTVCHGTEDDSLLLLCDLCDSAVHTYCAGLGMTVPESDWFCHDCAISRDDHVNSDRETDCHGDCSLQNFSVRPSVAPDVSIFHIVQEPNIPEVEESHTEVSSHTNQLSSPTVDITDNRVADNMTEASRCTSPGTGSGTRTLRHCRYIHKHIRALRENWNALRSGSLAFSSHSSDSGQSSNEKRGAEVILTESPSSTNGHLTKKDRVSDSSPSNGGPYDVSKAWRMMNMAKSMQRDSARTFNIQGPLKHSFGKRNGPQKVTKSNSSLPISKCRASVTKGLGSIGSKRPFNYEFNQKINKEFKIKKSEYQGESRVFMKGASNFNEVSPTTHLPVHSELLSSPKFQTPVPADVSHKNGEKSICKNSHEVPSAANEHNQSDCFFPLVQEVVETSVSSHSKPDLGISSSCAADLMPEQEGTSEFCAKSKRRKGGAAKSEIQSLVKLNLKLLSGQKPLGVDTFKEVARLATHTILAACGLEHKKSGSYSFPCSVCCHTKQIQQLRKSTLMPNSCRECFYAFVKDVVESIMADKLSCGQKF